MKEKLRVVFCILSCIGVLATFFVGVFWGLTTAIICLFFTLVCVGLMFFFKNGGKIRQPEEEKPDFMKSDEENERINNAGKK